jgi:hypothetical protein
MNTETKYWRTYIIKHISGQKLFSKIYNKVYVNQYKMSKRLKHSLHELIYAADGP